MSIKYMSYYILYYINYVLFYYSILVGSRDSQLRKGICTGSVRAVGFSASGSCGLLGFTSSCHNRQLSAVLLHSAVGLK